MPTSIHKNLLKISKTSYPTINSLIEHNGVIELEPKKEIELFPFMAKTVVSQLLSVAAASTIWGRINELANSEGREIKDLFCAEHEKAVRACGLSNSKFKAISGFKELLDAELGFAKTLLIADYNEIKKSITSLWGFGDWSADICSIFYCGLPDVYAAKDVAVVNAIKKLCGDAQKPEHIAKQFSPYQSYFCRHLWLGINNGYIASVIKKANP